MLSGAVDTTNGSDGLTSNARGFCALSNRDNLICCNLDGELIFNCFCGLLFKDSLRVNIST